METLIQDIRYAIRTLTRRPAFTLAAVLTLALGIGANTAIFGVLDSVLMRPPEGVGEPDRLIALYTSDFSGPAFGRSSYPDWQDLSTSPAFAGLAAVTETNLALLTDGRAVAVDGRAVSASFFEVLRVRPAAGRFFRADEESAPGDIAVVSHAFWQERMGGTADAVGRTLRLNDRPVEVIGVAPPGFVGFDRSAQPDLWVPNGTAARLNALFVDPEGRGSRGYQVVGRLAQGVTVAQAQQAMDAAAAQLHGLDTGAWTDVTGAGRRITVLAEDEVRVSPQSRGLVVGVAGILAGASALVLLLCCANVAGLLIARATGRQREVGIRLSLGAGRTRLVRQLLTESLVLAALGGVAGVLLAFWSTELLAGVSELRTALGVPLEVRTDVRVLGFAAALSLATALVFGLAPALRSSRVDLAATMRTESTGASGSPRAVTRGVLVGAQIAVSVVLLVGATLLVRTLRTAYAADPGFETENVLVVPARPLPGSAQGSAQSQQALEVRARLAALPGVEAAGWGWTPPLTGGAPRRSTQLEGYQPGQGEDMGIHVDHVGPGFFETLRIPLVAGRVFTDGDRDGSQPVAIVNRAFVERYWPGRDPIGRTLSQGFPADFTVVGVVGDARILSATEEAPPVIYLSALQLPRAHTFYVRTSVPPETLVPQIREVVAAAAPGWDLAEVRTMADQRGATLGGQRLAGGAVGLFAVLALVLATIGLYGVIAFAVSRRAREIGVRVALGARPSEVVGLFLRQALPIIGGGAFAGFVLAIAATRALRGLLIGVAPTDPASYALAAALLVVVALLATWWPARRATRVDPMIALRSE